MARIADLIAADPDELFPGSPSKDTVHRIIGSSEFPPQQANVVSVAAVLAREARWDATDTIERVRTAWVKALLAEPPGKPLSELDPYALEVHQSITIAEDKNAPALPTYVVRDHDRQVRERVDRTLSDQSVIITLVGESSTGKTRTLWEAIQHLPSNWRLWQALDSAPHGDLAVELEKIGPYTVVWLNEAQRFLLTADPAEGERVAAALRRIVHSPERHPVLILVTLWPKYWEQLTSEPADGHRDSHPHARHILNGSSVRVPVTFESGDLDNLKEAAARDARIAQALEHAEQLQVTQYLAGVPELIQRYQTAPPPARAVIDAAIDIRRLGFGEHLPLELIEAAAYEYLTDLQFDHLPDDWLEDALAYAAKPQRGIRGPLTRIRPRHKGKAEKSVRYRLADPLDQLGRANQHRAAPPPGLWDLLMHHASPTEALGIGRSAESHCFYRTAVEFYKKSADAGSSDAALEIADFFAIRDRAQEAVEWHEKAYSLGASHALKFAAQTLVSREEADWESAKRYWMRAARDGDIFALSDCKNYMTEWEYDGDPDEWFQQALDEVGHHTSDESVLAWCEKNSPAHELGRLLITYGRPAKGLKVLEESARKGNFYSMYELINERLASGGMESALEYLKELGRTNGVGAHLAPLALKRIMLRDQRGDECAALLEEMIENGNESASKEYSELMRALGRGSTAIDFLHAHSAGNPRVTCELAELLHQEHKDDEAIELLLPLAIIGVSRAQFDVACLLERKERSKEALSWFKQSAENGKEGGASRAVTLQLRTNQTSEVLTWLRSISTIDTSRERIGCAARVLNSLGRHKEAEQLEGYGWEPDGTVSASWLISPSASKPPSS
ncbi:hypothetical protein [Streptomyces sp. NPDC012825]|uniref:hypothetical protein n=1 Tax=Streptomyces sp. NPDC012825 TaxID=3364851 RepID=UPI00369AA47D